MGEPAQFWHLIVDVTPFACDTMTFHVVISEDPLEFAQRHHAVFACVVAVRQMREISEATYRRYRGANPRSYVKLTSGDSPER